MNTKKNFKNKMKLAYEDAVINLLAKGNLPEAKRLLEKHLHVKEDAFFTFYHLGFTNRFLNKFEDAISYYQKALRIHPKNHSVAYGLGSVYQHMGAYETALHYFDEAIKSTYSINEIVTALNSIGHTYRKMEEHDLALQAYERGIDKLIFGIINSMENSTENPIADFKQTKSTNWLRHSIDQLTLQAKKHGYNKVTFPTAKSIQTETTAKLHEGLYYCDENNIRFILPNYLDTIRQTLENEPLYAQLCNNIAIIYSLKGQTEKAKAMFKESIDFIPPWSSYKAPFIGLESL